MCLETFHYLFRGVALCVIGVSLFVERRCSKVEPAICLETFFKLFLEARSGCQFTTVGGMSEPMNGYAHDQVASLPPVRTDQSMCCICTAQDCQFCSR